MFKVILVLGKRLVNDELTQEGLSRVEALPQLLSKIDKKNLALVFCGGVTDGQTVSEADAMYGYFTEILPNHGLTAEQILLEQCSVNTVENISNAADKLIESRLCRAGQKVECIFVSNDYHLERVFEIQTLMDEQGLLRVLKEKCCENGLDISISYQLADHCVVAYPHAGLQAESFLAIDELTTYRVYLEGVKRGAFQRPLVEVRAKPLEIARKALNKVAGHRFTTEVMERLEEVGAIVEATVHDISLSELTPMLARFDSHLTYLNRYFDPEQTLE